MLSCVPFFFIVLVAFAFLPVAQVAPSPVRGDGNNRGVVGGNLLASGKVASGNRTLGKPVTGFWNRTRATGAMTEAVSVPMARAASPMSGVPNSFSWNGYFGGPNYMTPIKDQGSCGSCWAFGAVGGTEAQYQINRGNPNTGIDLSEQNLLQCSGGSCSGWYLSYALDFLMSSGTPDEACNPYTASDHSCGTGRCADYLSRTYYVTSWSYISTDTANIKNFLYTHGPVMVWMPVFADFPWYDASFWQNHFYGHSSSGSYGGHTVVIVGWDDQGSGTSDDYWIARNSWGTSGGDVNSGYGGYFYMTQDPTNGFFGIYQEAAIVSDVSAPTPVTRTATSTQTQTSTLYSSATTTATITSYTSTTTSTSTIPTLTTVAMVPLTVTSTVQSTQYLTSIIATTVTSYTDTETSTSTVPTTVALVPVTIGSTVQSTQFLTSTATTTVTSYTTTTTSTITSPVYTTITVSPGGSGTAASNALTYLGFLPLLTLAIGHIVNHGKSDRILRARSRMKRRCCGK
jgi:hypothetical protein